MFKKKITAKGDRISKVGELVREIREDRGLSIDALAEASGLSRSAVFRLEKGDSAMTLDKLSVLCRALGRSLTVSF